MKLVDLNNLEAARMNRERIAQAHTKEAKVVEVSRESEQGKHKRKGLVYKCQQCGHEWHSKAPPRQCPKCWSRKWGTPKEFPEEVEDTNRHCLFCDNQPPDDLPCGEMRGGKDNWYSNALSQNGIIARFYLCPNHLDKVQEGWQWAKQGFEEAGNVEKTIFGERAKTDKKPISHKRAASVDKHLDSERAKKTEKTTIPEQAVQDEKIAQHKRASNVEKPIAEERAFQNDEHIDKERARQGEKTTIPEQAIPNEKTTQQERAQRQDKHKEGERSPIPKKPSPGPHVDYLLELHNYYQENREAILKDLAELGEAKTVKRWKISRGTLSKLSKQAISRDEHMNWERAEPGDEHIDKERIQKPLGDYEPGCTEEEFFSFLKKTCRPVSEVQRKSPSEMLAYGLGLLKDNTVRAFKSTLAKPHMEYYEVLVEVTDPVGLGKLLSNWDEYVQTLPNCQHTRGARLVLRALMDLWKAIEKMKPSEKEPELDSIVPGELDTHKAQIITIWEKHGRNTSATARELTTQFGKEISVSTLHYNLKHRWGLIPPKEKLTTAT
jgi:predicted Zn-ribbon and HTH transcriptional regulator